MYQSSEPLIINQYDIQRDPKELGRGGFGIVYKGQWQGHPVAIKELASSANFPADESKEFKKEIQIMQGLKHANIVQLLGYSVEPSYCIVMEYMPDGSLYRLLHDKQPINWEVRLKIAIDISQGMEYLHANKVIHRDIKSTNVLLNGATAKLMDFGLAKIKTYTRRTTTQKTGRGVVGTLSWMAPEILQPTPLYSYKSDIYSLGITFWEVASRMIPFENANPYTLAQEVLSGKRPELKHSEDCPQVHVLTPLIKQCWDVDLDKRPNATKIVDALKKLNQESTASQSTVTHNSRHTQSTISGIVPIPSEVSRVPVTDIYMPTGSELIFSQPKMHGSYMDGGSVVPTMSSHGIPSQHVAFKPLEETSKIEALVAKIDQLLVTIKEGTEKIKSEDQEIILVCGNTGAGKSTLLNYITNKKIFTKSQENDQRFLIDCDDVEIPIGHGNKSQTYYPQKVKYNGLVFWDCPGFEDTRGSEVDIANAFYINQLFLVAEKVKIILVTEEASLTGDKRGQSFKQLTMKLADIFVNKDQLMASLALIFTKVRDIHDFSCELKKILAEDHSLTVTQRTLIAAIIDQSKIGVFHMPKDGLISEKDKNEINKVISDTVYAIKPKINVSVAGSSLLFLQQLACRVEDNIKVLIIKVARIMVLSINQQNDLGILLAIDQTLKDFSNGLYDNGKTFSKEEFLLPIESIVRKFFHDIHPQLSQHLVEIKRLFGYFETFFTRVKTDLTIKVDDICSNFLTEIVPEVQKKITNIKYKDDIETRDKILKEVEVKKELAVKQCKEKKEKLKEERKIAAKNMQILEQRLGQERVNAEKIKDEMKEVVRDLKQEQKELLERMDMTHKREIEAIQKGQSEAVEANKRMLLQFEEQNKKLEKKLEDMKESTNKPSQSVAPAAPVVVYGGPYFYGPRWWW